MNECGNAKREETQFESLLREFENSVAESQSNADAYGSLVGRLDSFDLSCDQPIKCSNTGTPSTEPNNVIYKLNYILGRLQNANRKNNEIIENFKRLV